MATNRLSENESASVGELIKGIVQDLDRLASQHVRLFKQDLKKDARQMTRGATLLAIGGAVLLIAGALLGVMLAQVLIEQAHLPAWGAYGLVGVLFAVAGGVLAAVGCRQLQKANPLNDQSVETLTEDAKWLTNPK